MGTISTKVLTEKIDALLEETNAHYRVESIVPTRYSRDQYEEGACRQVINFKTLEGKPCYFSMLCFLTKKQLRHELDSGRILAIKTVHYSSGLELTTKII